MPAYVTYQEVKDQLADTMLGDTREYDVMLRRLAEKATSTIDRFTGRSFFAKKKVWYDDIDYDTDTWFIPDCLNITSIELSGDDGETYSYYLNATDYRLYGGPGLEYNELPYQKIKLSVNGDYGVFYQGENAIKVTGLFGWHDDYASAWDNSLDTIENDPNLPAATTTITVNDADGTDLWSVTPRFKVGQVIRLGTDEQCEVTHVDPVGNILTVRRAIHGTTAPTTTAKDTAIYIYRPPQVVSLATAIQVARWFKRAQQAYQNASSSSGFGQMIFVQRFDPEIMAMLWDAGLRRINV